MSASIVKFKLQITQSEAQPDHEVKKYVQVASVDIDSPEDSMALKELNAGAEGEDAICLYLVELAAGSSNLTRTASFGYADGDTISSVSSYDDDVISLLTNFFQTSLGVPKTLFEDHIARGPKFRFSEDFQTPRAPTAMHANRSFVLRYYELISYTGDPSTMAFLPGQDDACFSCAATGRHIVGHHWHASRIKEGMLLIVPRKCSFWRHNKGDRGYDTVILCDPRPSTACLTGRSSISLEPHIPFNGGYPDFLFHAHLTRSDSTIPPPGFIAPPRISFATDFSHYLTTYPDSLSRDGNPPSVSLLVKKLVAAHYTPLIAFVTFQISSMRSRGWALQRSTQVERDAARTVEEDWSRFRHGEYLEDMEANLDALGLPRTDFGSDTNINDWRHTDGEFRWIYQQLSLRQADYYKLTTSMAALAGIISTRQALEETRLQKEEAVRALREAKSMKTLTVIAMAFAPLAWTSGLFNMSEPFAPGGPKFWVYFAVALPATFVVFLVTLLADKGYDGRAEWSVGTFYRSFTGLLKSVSSRKEVRSTSSKVANG